MPESYWKNKAQKNPSEILKGLKFLKTFSVDLSLFERHRLRNKILILTRLGVIVCPTVNHRKWTRPVTVYVFNRSRPFQSIRTPRILNGTLPSVYTIDEVKGENRLRHATQQGKHCDQNRQVCEVRKDGKFCIAIITSRNTRQTLEVLWEEYAVGTYEG